MFENLDLLADFDGLFAIWNKLPAFPWTLFAITRKLFANLNLLANSHGLLAILANLLAITRKLFANLNLLRNHMVYLRF
ncbi:MAG TPA: hypothetical protein VNR38_18740 [Ureibacillus sp.]|nr:hypothetical protein [Ureibacillus sp.]